MNRVAFPKVVLGEADVASSSEGAPPPAFERALLTQQTFKVWMTWLLFDHLDPLFALMRWVAPISIHFPLPLNGRPTWFVFITRAENVRDVLNNNATFKVPYKPKLEGLSGSGFLLGQDGPREHQADLKIAAKAFPLSDIPELARFAATLADESVGSAPSGDWRLRCHCATCTACPYENL